MVEVGAIMVTIIMDIIISLHCVEETGSEHLERLDRDLQM